VCDIVVKKVHVRYLIFWWVLVRFCAVPWTKLATSSDFECI